MMAEPSCDECGTPYRHGISPMETLCAECAHVLYGYPPCPHSIGPDGRCSRCGWNQARSAYVSKVLRERGQGE
jgi:hypothetical protein